MKTTIPAEYSPLLHLFDIIDTDDDGKISLDDLKQFYSRNNLLNFDSAQLQRTFALHSAGSQQLTFVQFIQFFKAQLRPYFAFFDVTRDGFIDAVDLHWVTMSLRRHSVRFPDIEVADLLAEAAHLMEADTNNDGLVSFPEFVVFVLKPKKNF